MGSAVSGGSPAADQALREELDRLNKSEFECVCVCECSH
eukprot:gene789-1103_t